MSGYSKIKILVFSPWCSNHGTHRCELGGIFIHVSNGIFLFHRRFDHGLNISKQIVKRIKVKELVVDYKMEVKGCNDEAPWYLPVPASGASKK